MHICTCLCWNLILSTLVPLFTNLTVIPSILNILLPVFDLKISYFKYSYTKVRYSEVGGCVDALYSIDEAQLLINRHRSSYLTFWEDLGVLSSSQWQCFVFVNARP